MPEMSDLQSNSRILLIYLKEPIAGQVKTRLAKKLGAERACAAYQAMVSVLLDQLKWIPHCHYRFCYTPAEAKQSIIHWILPQLEHQMDYTSDPEGVIKPLRGELPTVDFVPQGGGDLGERLTSSFAQAFEEGFSEVAVIGSDCPTLSARWIETAFTTTKKADLTIGPTSDGGYYLLSLKRRCDAVFQGIQWSTASVREETIAQAEQAGLVTHSLPPLGDIDTLFCWEKSLASPLGARLKAHYNKLCDQQGIT